jgi:hypothetical protein
MGSLLNNSGNSAPKPKGRAFIVLASWFWSGRQLSFTRDDRVVLSDEDVSALEKLGAMKYFKPVKNAAEDSK